MQRAHKDTTFTKKKHNTYIIYAHKTRLISVRMKMNKPFAYEQFYTI